MHRIVLQYLGNYVSGETKNNKSEPYDIPGWLFYSSDFQCQIMKHEGLEATLRK